MSRRPARLAGPAPTGLRRRRSPSWCGGWARARSWTASARSTAGALAAAAGLAVLTTVCCAWRWKIVARGLGVGLSLPAAVAAYYRSLFLNVTLPGGIVGDVHRAVSHGREVSDVGRALRAVAWERFAGQVVQAVLTVAVLLALPSPVRSSMPFVALGGSPRRRVGAVLVARARVRRAGGCSPAGRGSVSRSRRRSSSRPRGHVPDRRADRGRHGAGVADAAAGAARDARHGAAQRRRLGAARGRGGVGVRRGRPGCGPGRRHRRRLRRDGVRRQPSGRRRLSWSSTWPEAGRPSPATPCLSARTPC